MRKPHIIIILLTVLSMTSCNRGHGPDKQFLENESITLTIRGQQAVPRQQRLHVGILHPDVLGHPGQAGPEHQVLIEIHRRRNRGI